MFADQVECLGAIGTAGELLLDATSRSLGFEHVWSAAFQDWYGSMRANHATKKFGGVVPMVYEHAYWNYLMYKWSFSVLYNHMQSQTCSMTPGTLALLPRHNTFALQGLHIQLLREVFPAEPHLFYGRCTIVLRSSDDLNTT